MQRNDKRGVDPQPECKRRARMVQFFVVGDGKDWVVKTKTRSAGRYADRLKAISAAIDLANAEGKAGRAAQVLTEKEESTPEIIWTYGEDLYPSAVGKPNSGKSRGSYRMP
jgi:hypothetical protein